MRDIKSDDMADAQNREGGVGVGGEREVKWQSLRIGKRGRGWGREKGV